MIIGTSHFYDRWASVQYYRTYGYSDPVGEVRRKLAAGEIHIGAPTAQPGDRVYLNLENRYMIEERATK